MASNVVPQALLSIPSNHSIQCHPLKKQQLLGFGFGFQLDVNRRLSLSDSRGNPMSSNSCNHLSSNFSSIFSFPARNSFFVRSEAEDAPEPTDTLTPIAEDDNNSESEPEPEAEPTPPRQPRVKLGDIMGLLNKRAVQASDDMRPVPDIRVGDIVQIKLEVPDNRKRLSIYKGIVISRQNAGIHTTFRTRRIIAGVGVEIVFPLYSPNIKEIKVVNHRKVRKAKLFYLRDKLPRLSSFK